MEDPEHREYMFGTEVSEVDGKYLLLYTSRDTSRVSAIHTLFHISYRFKEKQTMDSRFDRERNRAPYQVEQSHRRV